MSVLPTNLIKEFVKETNDANPSNNSSSTHYGTAVVNGTGMFVKFDGSEMLTPVSMATDAKNDDRVLVTIENHKARIVSNFTSPASGRTATDLYSVETTEDGTVVVKGELRVAKEYVDELIGNDITAATIKAQSGEFEVLKSKQASFETATAENFKATNAELESVSGNFESFKTGEFETLKAKQADFEDVTTSNFTAVNGRIDTVSGDLADYKKMIADEMLVAKGWMAEGAIGDALISNVSANKIRSGTVDTSLVTVLGSDGRLQIADNTIQISDANRVRVQIGKDVSNDYSMSVWDASGNLIWDALGATENTIQRKIIRDRMVADDANIQGYKLDIDSVVREVNGAAEKISSTVVQVGDKSLHVFLEEQNNTITEQSKTLSSHSTQIKANQDNIALKVSTQDFIKYKADINGKMEEVGNRLTTVDTSIVAMQGQIALKVEQTDIDTAVQGIEIGGRNLASKANIFGYNCTPAISGSGYTIAAESTSVGLKFPSSMFEVGQLYALSFKITVNSGEINSIAGHSNGFTTNSILIDGVKPDSNNNSWPLVHPVSWVSDTHEVVVYLLYNGTGTDNNLYIQPNRGGTATDYNITIFDIQIEKGNKVTDWTPAPEDIEASITDVDNKFSSYSTTAQMNSTITAAKDEINLSVSSTYATKSSVQTVDRKFANYSTTQQMNSAIQAKADSITQSVSATYATKSDLISNVNTLNASLELKVNKDKLISEINASADVITLTGNRFIVNSDNFKLTADGTMTAQNGIFSGTLNGATGSFSGSLSVSGTYIPQDLTLEDARKFNTVINKDGLVTSDTEYYTAKLYPDSLEISYPDIGEYGSGKDMQTIITADHVAVTSTDGSQPNSEMSREGFYAYGPNDDLVRESHMDGYGLTISSYEYAAGHLTPVSNIFMENNSISIEAPTTSQPKVTVNNGEYGVGLLIGAGGVNHGLYDFTNGRWMIYKGSAEATTMTQDTFTIGNKTGYQDGKTGISLFRDGYMHLQRASSGGDPYIGFYRDASTSVASLALKSNNKFRFNKALELNGTNIDSVGQQGIYSMDMSNYVIRYYVAGSTKCTALGNNSYATRIYGSSVWANKAVSTSDERLKTDFKSLDSVMNIFMELEPVSFRWKQDYEDGDNLIHFGLKAQQVEKTFKKYGYNTDDYSVIGEFGGYKGICYDDLFMMAMCATQKNTKELMHQAGQIDLHETMIQDLQNQIYQLQKQLKELRQASA